MNSSAQPPASNAMKGIGIALLAFSIFATHDALIKSVEGIPSIQVAFFVVLFSFVPFTLFLAVDRTERSLRPRLPGLVALRCLFTAAGLLSVFYSFQNLPLAEVYSLLFSAPILITLLAIPILGERIKLIRWIAILLGMAGVLVVLQPGEGSLSVHHLAALMAAICVACSSIVTRKIGAREHSVTLVLYPMLTNVFVSGVIMSNSYVPMPGEVLAKLALIGVLSVIAQTLMIYAYRISEAQFVAPMQYSQMLWALIFGAYVFGEQVSQSTLMGSAIIVLSGLLFIWRELVVSVTQPVLNTRNLRLAGGPATRPAEADDAEMMSREASEKAASKRSATTVMSKAGALTHRRRSDDPDPVSSPSSGAGSNSGSNSPS